MRKPSKRNLNRPSKADRKRHRQNKQCLSSTAVITTALVSGFGSANGYTYTGTLEGDIFQVSSNDPEIFLEAKTSSAGCGLTPVNNSSCFQPKILFDSQKHGCRTEILPPDPVGRIIQDNRDPWLTVGICSPLTLRNTNNTIDCLTGNAINICQPTRRIDDLKLLEGIGLLLLIMGGLGSLFYCLLKSYERFCRTNRNHDHQNYISLPEGDDLENKVINRPS